MRAAVVISGAKKSGTSTGVCGANENVFVVWNSSTSIFILDAEGQMHINETSTDTFPTIDCKQSSTGDVGIRFGLGSTQSFMIGMDNTNGDRLAISTAASATSVVGTGDVFAIDVNGNVQSGGDGALATNATNGFLYLRTCAGTPTGTPTAITGFAAMVYDTTNNKLYVYNGAWKAVTLA